MEKTIICIGREYGSGGHAIGKILAKRTGYEFYDKERFIAIAKERGFEGEVEEYLEEQPMNSLLYSIAMNYSRPKKNWPPRSRASSLAAAPDTLHVNRTMPSVYSFMQIWTSGLLQSWPVTTSIPA